MWKQRRKNIRLIRWRIQKNKESFLRLKQNKDNKKFSSENKQKKKKNQEEDFSLFTRKFQCNWWKLGEKPLQSCAKPIGFICQFYPLKDFSLSSDDKKNCLYIIIEMLIEFLKLFEQHTFLRSFQTQIKTSLIWKNAIFFFLLIAFAFLSRANYFFHLQARLIHWSEP